VQHQRIGRTRTRRDTPVGREAERARLDALLAAAHAGRGVCVLLEGPAGIGKTCLVAALVATARDRGIDVVEAAARPHAVTPLAVALGAPRPPAARAAGPARAGATDYDHALAEGLVTAVERAAGGGALVVAVDDLHWADRASVRALAVLGERVPHLPVLLVLSARPAAWPDELVRAATVRVELGALDDDAARALVERHGGDPTDVGLARAAGNPFWLIQLARGAAGDPAAPPADAVLGSLAWMADDELAAVQVASVLGAVHDVTHLAAALERTPAGVQEVLAPAVDAGILHVDAATVAFAHDLLRDTVYYDIPATLRAALHAEVARTLLAHGAALTDVAHHLALGDDGVPPDLALDAAAAVRPVDPALAVTLLERVASEREDVLPDLVAAMAEAGRLHDAEAVARRAAPTVGDAAVRARLHAFVGEVMLTAGAPAGDALALLHGAANEPSLAPDERARLLGDGCVAALVSGDAATAMGMIGEAVALEDAVEHRSSIVDAWCVRAWLESYTLDFDRALGTAGIAVDAMGDSLAARARSAPEFFAGMVMLDVDRLDDAVAVFGAGRDAATRAAAAWQLPLYHWGIGAARWLQGEWRDAVTEIDTGLSLARDLGSLLGTAFGHTVLALVALARDDLPDARRHVDGAAADFAAGGAPVGFDWYALATALLAESDGHPAAAGEQLAGVIELDLALGMLSDLGDLLPEYVRVATTTGDHDGARSLVARVADAAGGRAHPPLAAACARCDARLGGDPDRAVEAVALARGGARPLVLADTLTEAAVIAAGAGRAGTVDLLEEALACYERLGAVRHAARALAAARDAGLRTRRFAPRARPRTGWDALSPTEMDVVRLVAEGLTNPAIGERMFISRRTAETHVRHALVKLGVSTRVELAAAYRARSG
jgi:DNA-binding CsgD family transcriptional regulator